MARICRRKTEIVLVVDEIIFEIVFMLSVILNRYRNMGHHRGLDVEHLLRYRMADRIPQQIEHMSELVDMSDTHCLENLRLDPCALIHNFIHNEMPNDLLVEGLLPDTQNQTHDEELIDSVHPSQEWTREMASGLADHVSKPLMNINDKGRRG
ncbi:hypothetical protein ACS0TY_018123 [Phlomoides rotata]